MYFKDPHSKKVSDARPLAALDLPFHSGKLRYVTPSAHGPEVYRHVDRPTLVLVLRLPIDPACAGLLIKQ
jgi:hypothetical protein